MVARLVRQVLASPLVSRVAVTLNIPESSVLPDDCRISIVENSEPRGFGTNHNAAFRYCNERYFCPLNPDIELKGDPFPILVDALEAFSASVVAPLVLSPSGEVEDNLRFFPTLGSLAVKALKGEEGRYALGEHEVIYPEWVAGMFMLFRSKDYASLCGFDERFYLYYEDVDICARAWQLGLKVLACPEVAVVHDARRASRRSVRHLRWHLASMARYLWMYRGRLPKVKDKVESTRGRVI